MNPATFRSDLKTQLDLRSGLTSINAEVFRYPPGSKARMAPTLFFDQLQSVFDEDLNLLADRDTTYNLTGGGYAPSSGAEATKWATAEANANTLLEELRAQLVADQTVNGNCERARMVEWTTAPSQTDDGKMFFDFTFTIEVRDLG